MSQTERILILDDDPNLRKTLGDILRLKGYDVLPVARSQEALEAAGRGEIAVALIDLRLEDLPGLDVLKRIKDLSPETECIILTGYASQEAAIEAVNAGAYSFLQKPYEMPQVLLTLQRALEKRAAARRLRESETRFRSLAESTATAIFVYSGEKFMYVNRATEELTGYPAAELLAMRFWDVVHPDFREMIRQRGLARQRGEPVPPRYEFKIVRKDGEERWIDFTAGRIEWQGQPAAIGTAFDITERKRWERELLESEARYAALVETSPAGIFRTDAEGKTTYVSRRWCEISGLDGEAALGDGWLAAVHPEDRQALADGWQQASLHRQPSTAEYRFIRPDGSVRWVRGQAVPETDAEGNVLGYVGAITDVTEEKAAEAALQDRLVQLTALSRASQAVSASLDLDTTLREIIALSREVSGAEYASVVLLDESGGMLQSAENLLGLPALEGRARRKGFTQWIAANRQPLLVERVDKNGHIYPPPPEGAPRSLNPYLRQKGIQSLAGLPLVVEERVVGVLYLHSTKPNAFDGQLPLLNAFAAQAAIALQKARLYQMAQKELAERARAEAEVRRRAEEFAALYETARDLAAQSELLPILHSITQHACSLLHAASGNVYLYDPQRGDLELTISTNPVIPTGSRLSLGQGMAGRVAQSGQPLIVDDYHTWEGRAPQYDDIPFRAVIQVPMLYQQTLIGVLSVAELGDSERKFSQEDLHLLTLFAHQAALAVGKARLYEETRQRVAELEMLYENSLSISRLLEPREIAREMLEVMKKKLAWHHVSIRLRRGESRDLELVAFHQTGMKPEEEEMIGYHFQTLISSMDQGLSGLAARRGETILAGNVHDFPEYVEVHAAIRSGLYTPLKVGENVIGVIAVESEQPQAFSAADARLLETLAAQAAVAIENARLYVETAYTAERQAILHSASSEIALNARSLDDLYASIYRAASQLMPADNFTIALHDEARGEFVGEYLIDEGQRCPPVRASLQQGISGHVIRTNVPLRIGDALNEPGAPTPVHYGSDRPSRAYLAVPLRIGERVIGAMSVQSYEPNAYSQEDEVLLEMLAGYAAPAIESARLFERTRQHAENLKAIQAMGRGLAETFDLAAIYEQVRQSIFALLPEISGVMINLFDNEKQLITPAYCYTDDAVQDVSALPPIPLAPPGEGTQSRAIRSRQPVVINHFQEQLKKARVHVTVGQAGPPRRSSMYVPMLTQGKVVGLIIVQSPVEERFSDADVELTGLIANTAAVAIENARLFEETRRRLQELETLQNVSAALRQAHTIEEMVSIFVRCAVEAVGANAGSIYLLEESTQNWVSRGWIDPAGNWILPPSELRHPPGDGVTGYVGASGNIYVTEDWRTDPLTHVPPQEIPLLENLCGGISLPLQAEEQVVGVLHVWYASCHTFSESEKRLLMAIADMAGNAIRRAALYEQTRHNAERLLKVNALGRALAATLDIEETYRLTYNYLSEIVDCPNFGISLFDEDKQLIRAAFVISDGQEVEVSRFPPLRYDPENTIAGRSRAIATHQPVIQTDLARLAKKADATVVDNHLPESAVYLPMLVKDRVIGLLELQSYLPRAYSTQDVELLSMMANQIGLSIQNARLFAETQRQLNFVSALHTTDVAISSSLDLNLTLNITLQHVLEYLGVDVAALYLFNASLQKFEFAVGRGFSRVPVIASPPRLQGELMNRVILGHKPVIIPDLRSAGDDIALQPWASEYSAYVAYPLIAKGEVKGLLEAFSRSPLDTNTEWMGFIETLAGQAAVAIDNATLFDDLQRANLELTLAYDATIEGWSSALDLRDKETEGHTRRVTDLTLRLARQMGIPEADLVHIRRGALLHDIGKMGIPDSILLKPGSLTAEEWNIMRQHPVYAYKMLSPITFLKPALDIPYCHHEKWDGTGYPRGLKGEQIPLAARIFAVVDVWDALTSDRPYRAAWSHEQALAYISEQAGKHFDPRVVDVFLDLIKNEIERQ
jgi:PAS domain S-box-containing protein/putative nucleotidyltransferase with HDIG domain